MMGLSVGLVKPDKLERRIAAAIVRTVRAISAFAQRVAKLAAPAFTGELRNSIVQLNPKPPEFQGGIITNVAHAVVMEDGRGAGKGFPPVDAITRWVFLKRKDFGIKPKEVKSVAFLVGRSIARKGIKGRRYFEKARRVTNLRLGEFARSLGIEIQRAWGSGG